MAFRYALTTTFACSDSNDRYKSLFNTIYNELKALSTDILNNKIMKLSKSSKETKILTNRNNHLEILYKKAKSSFSKLHELDEYSSYVLVNIIQCPVYSNIMKIPDGEFCPEYIINNGKIAKHFLATSRPAKIKADLAPTAYGGSHLDEWEYAIKPVLIDTSMSYSYNFIYNNNFPFDVNSTNNYYDKIEKHADYNINKLIAIYPQDKIISNRIRQHIPGQINIPTNILPNHRNEYLFVHDLFRQLPNQCIFLNNSITLNSIDVEYWHISDSYFDKVEKSSINASDPLQYTKFISESAPNNQIELDKIKFNAKFINNTKFKSYVKSIYSDKNYYDYIMENPIFGDILISSNIGNNIQNKLFLNNENYIYFHCIKNNIPIIAVSDYTDYSFSVSLFDTHRRNMQFAEYCISRITDINSFYKMFNANETNPLCSTINNIRNYIGIADKCYEVLDRNEKINLISNRTLYKIDELFNGIMSSASFGFNALYNFAATEIFVDITSKDDEMTISRFVKYYINHANAFVILTGLETKKDLEMLTDYVIKRLINYPNFKIPITTGMVMTKIIDRYVNMLNFTNDTKGRFINNTDIPLGYQTYIAIKNICREFIEDVDKNYSNLDTINQSYCQVVNKFYSSMVEIAKLLTNVQRIAKSAKELLLKIMKSMKDINIMESNLDFSYYAYDVEFVYNQNVLKILYDYHENHINNKCGIIKPLSNLAKDKETAFHLIILSTKNKLPYLIKLNKLNTKQIEV